MPHQHPLPRDTIGLLTLELSFELEPPLPQQPADLLMSVAATCTVAELYGEAQRSLNAELAGEDTP